MKAKVKVQEMTKLPAISTIVSNRSSLTIQDIDHLRLLAIKEKERLQKSVMSAQAKIKATEEVEDFLTFCQSRLSEGVDNEDTLYVRESGIVMDADNQEDEIVEDTKVM